MVRGCFHCRQIRSTRVCINSTGFFRISLSCTEFSVNLVSGNDSWDYSFMSTAMAPEINLLSFSGDLSLVQQLLL